MPDSTASRSAAEVATALPPMPGKVIDPPGKDFAATQQMLDQRLAAAGLIFRTANRFLQARGPLLTAGTTYYLFLSLISLVAFAYGVISVIGADQMSAWLTDALNSAFPGLLGDEGVSPEAIREYGTLASGVGLLVLGLAGTSSVMATSQSLHTIYGAPNDPRNYLLNKVRMFGMLLILGPLILLSFIPSVLITSLAKPIMERVGLDGGGARVGLLIASTLLGIALSFVIIYLILGWLGGIRPAVGPRRIGAFTGAVVMEVLKYASATVIAWSLGRPQYGALSVPITLMLVLYLQTTTLYLSACLTAAIAVGEAERADS